MEILPNVFKSLICIIHMLTSLLLHVFIALFLLKITVFCPRKKSSFTGESDNELSTNQEKPKFKGKNSAGIQEMPAG